MENSFSISDVDSGVSLRTVTYFTALLSAICNLTSKEALWLMSMTDRDAPVSSRKMKHRQP